MALEGEQLGFLEKTVKLIEKYGLFKIFKALLVIAMFVFVMVNGADFISNIINTTTKSIIKEQAAETTRIHDIALDKRKKIKPQVDKILKDILNSLDADRSFIIEMHNGTNNTSGLPFLYGEMTYEDVSDGIEHIDGDYINLALSRFSFPTYMEKEHLWIGTIDELSKIDDKLSKRLISNDVTYIAICHIHGLNNEIGYFGITYCNNKPPKPRSEIVTKILNSTQKLSILLDSSTTIEDGDATMAEN